MKHIYLIRHGKPQNIDSEKRFLGRTDIPLSLDGMRSLAPLNAFFAENPPAAVISSPLTRCIQTAQIIFGKDCDIIRHSGFAEIDMGAWDNCTFEYIKQSFPQQFKDRGENPSTYRTPFGESFSDVQARAVSAFREIEHYPKPLAVVTHQGIIRCLMCCLDKKPLSELFNYNVPYASMREL
jgi:Fructose-2,6-bisphosphatase